MNKYQLIHTFQIRSDAEQVAKQLGRMGAIHKFQILFEEPKGQRPVFELWGD